MSDQTEGRRLPETWEEYDRAVKLRERAAFVRGVHNSGGIISTLAAEYEARQLYQITRKVPRKVNLFGDTTARMDRCGGVWFEDERGESIAKPHLCPESAAALRDLLDRPYDEVTE